MALTRVRAENILDSDFKNSCRATSFTNITLSGGAPNTLDGVTLALNDRILVQGQSDSTQNGIYYVSTLGSGSNGNWTRAQDASQPYSITTGLLVYVNEGTNYGQRFYYVTTIGNIIVGTSNINFANLGSNFSNITATNITANSAIYSNAYYYGNGTPFTSSSYGNTQVAAYLPTYSGNLTAGNITVNGNLFVTGNITTQNYETITQTEYANSIVASGSVTANGFNWSNGNAYGGYFTVSEINAANAYSNVLTNITTLRFDTATGFHVYPWGPNTAKIALGSSFSTWYVDGQGNLKAVGEDTVQFIAGSGISITTNNSSIPQSITISSTGTYSNSNVASYLPTYTGTLSPSSLTTNSGGQVSGYLTGAIGANSANSGAFTTLTATSTITAQGTVSAPTINASTIGNSGATLTGTLSTASQTNITSVGTLTSLNSTGTIAAPTVIAATIGNAGAVLYGTLNSQSASQTNITSVGTLTGLTTSGNITAQTANVYAAYVVANSGLSGTLITNAQTNITSVGTLTSLTSTGTIAANQVQAGVLGNSGALLQGTLITGAQGNITSIGTLTGLTSSGNITAQSANVYAAYVVANTASYSGQYYWTNGATLASTITGTYSNSNVNSYLPTYTGTLSPSSITTNNGGQLTGYLTGTIGANTPNTATFTTATVTNATNTSGLGTGALIVTQGGAAIQQDLYVGGNIYAANIISQTSQQLVVSDPLIYLSANAVSYNYEIGFYSHFVGGNINNYQHTGFTRNHVDNQWYLFSNLPEPSGGVVNLANTNIVYDTIKFGAALVQNTTVATNTTSGALQVAGGVGIVGAVYANNFNGVSLYAGTIGNTGATLTGTLSTAAQTNITSVGTLGSLTVSGTTNLQGTTNGATINATNLYATTIGNTAAAINGNLINGSAVYAGTIGNTGASLVGTLTTAAQTNITSTGALTSPSFTTSGGGQVIAYLTGAIGANTPNSGVFTTASTSGNLTVGGNLVILGNSYIGPVPTTFNYNAAPLNLTNSLAGALKTQLNLINTGGGAGAGSAIDFYTYTSVAGGSTPETRISTTDDGNYSGYIGLWTKAPGNTGANSLVERLRVDSAGNIVVFQTTTSTSTTTGAIVISGGMGVGGAVYANNFNAVSLYAGTIGNTGSTLTGTLSTAAQTNITSVGTLTGLTSSGNITAQTANVYAANLIGNIAIYGAQFYWSNGATLSGTITGTYSNSNVASYLPTYTGTLSPSSLTTNSGGQLTGYLTGAIGANAANSGVFTSVTASGTITGSGQIVGYLTGAIGANSANSGVFTTITSSGNITAQTANIYGRNIVGNSAVYSAAYYYSNGLAFSSGGGGGVTLTTSNTAPLSPSTGAQWYQGNTDILYEYISDATGASYWVDISSRALLSNGNTGATLGPSVGKIYALNTIFS